MCASGQRPDELDAQSDISMTSLTYEDGLAEIDSFFESPPDHRSSNVGDPATNKVPSGGGGVRPSAPSAPSLAQQPQPPDLQYGQVDMPTDHEAEQGSNEEFAALMEEFKQVTGAGSELAINPKGQLDFILNAAKSLPAEPVPDGYDYTLEHDFISAKTGQSHDSWESLDPGVATTVTEAPQVGSRMGDTTPSSPTESQTPSPPTFDSVTLASLQEDEDLAATSASREEQVLDRSSSATHPSPQQHLSQDQLAQTRGDVIHKDSSPAAENPPSPGQQDIPQQQLARSPIALRHETSSVATATQSQPPKEVFESQSKVATPPPVPSPQQTMPAMEAALQNSPTIPSSEGKHSLLEEMRGEEYDTEPTLAPGTFPQPDFKSGTKSNVPEAEVSDQAAISRQILEEASQSQRKAEALVVRTRSEEDRLVRARMVTNDEETDEDADSDVSNYDAPDQRFQVLQRSQKSNQALEELKATVASLFPPGSQAEPLADARDPSVMRDSKDEADGDSEDDDDSDSVDEMQVSEPFANATQKATEPQSTEVSQPPRNAKTIVTRARSQSEQRLDAEDLSNDADDNAEATSNSGGVEKTRDQAALSQRIVGDSNGILRKSKDFPPRITRSRVQPASHTEASSDNGEPEDEDVENKAMEADQAPGVVRVYPVKSIKKPAGSSRDPAEPTEEITESVNKSTKSKKKPAKASKKGANSKSKKAAQPRPQNQNVAHRHTRLSTLHEDDEDASGEESNEAEATIEPVSKPEATVKRKASPSKAAPAKRPKQEPARRTLRSREAEDKSIEEGKVAAAQTELATKPTVPAKRKATTTLVPKAKRGKQQLAQTSRGSSSQASVQEVEEVDAAPNQYHRVSNREQNNLHDKVWYNQDVTSGPRQTRGQKKEEAAKVPNPGKAAKERQKKIAG